MKGPVDKRSRHLTYANVVATLALVIAIGGGAAYAANTILSTDIVNGEVKTPDLATDAVTAPKIKAGEVKTQDLAGGAVTAAKLADGAKANVYARFTDEVTDLPDTFDDYGPFDFGHEAIVTLPLPTGSFQIQAKGFANGKAGNVGCVLVAGPNFDASLATLPADGTVEPLVMQVLHRFSEPGQAELRCTDYGGTVRGLYYVKLHATQVGSISNEPAP